MRKNNAPVQIAQTQDRNQGYATGMQVCHDKIIEDPGSSVIEGQLGFVRREAVRIRDTGLWCIIRLEIEDDGA